MSVDFLEIRRRLHIARTYKCLAAALLLGALTGASLRASEQPVPAPFTFQPAKESHAVLRPGETRVVKGRYTCTSETLVLDKKTEKVLDTEVLTRTFTRRETALPPDTPESPHATEPAAPKGLIYGWTLHYDDWKVTRTRNGKALPAPRNSLANKTFTLRHDTARAKLFLTDAEGGHVRGPLLLEVARDARPLLHRSELVDAAGALAGKSFTLGQLMPLKKSILLALSEIEPENLVRVQGFSTPFLEQSHTDKNGPALAGALLRAKALLDERGFAGMTKWEGALVFDPQGRLIKAILKIETRRAAVPPKDPGDGEKAVDPTVQAARKEVTRTREEVEWQLSEVTVPEGTPEK